MRVERDVPYAVYANVIKIGTAKDLQDVLQRRSMDDLKKLEAWVAENDRRSPEEFFYILETDGYRMPDEVQKLYGWRYLKALNAIKFALTTELGSRTLDAVLA